MLEKVRRFIAAEGLLSPGARVVVGFSGGADSVCLLETLWLLAPELSLTLFALHVHHGIRGKEADGDAAYAEDFCRKRGIPLRTVFRDIPAEARAKSLGLEEAGRLARREELTRALRELPADAAALAHHKNDLAETLLFQLARGTGLAGLSGISPANGAFIRPLLCLTRGEIEAWLLSRKISWREDSTNADTQYARNRIRHEILPGLSKVNAQAVTHMAEAASEVREAYTYLESLLPDRWRSCAAEGQGEIFLSAGELLAEPPLLQRMLIREAFRRLGGLKDLGKVHVEAVLDLLRGAEGRRRDLPGMLAVRTAKDVVLAKLGEIAVFGREKSGDGLDRRSDPARKEILVSGWERPGTGQAVSEPGETENARKGYLSGERTELKIPGETIYGGWRFKAEILCFAKAPGETTFDGQRCKAEILALHKFDNGNQRFPVLH
ncbi:MAG: tRNA lysidine(34) synthetase TilS, partial [Lachnospiraceae bacterium]